MKVLFIFPVTLFQLDYSGYDKIFLIEDPSFFCRYQFHKSKLVLHRASLQAFHDQLKSTYGSKVKYIEYDKADMSELLKGVKLLSYVDPIDHSLRRTIRNAATNVNIPIHVIESPGFLESSLDYEEFYHSHVTHFNYRHDVFYKWQRKRLNILMDGDKPLHGRWSFDTENRKAFTVDYKETTKVEKSTNQYVLEAKTYVNKHFGKNFGTHENFFYPVTHEEAQGLLNKFLKHSLDLFGPYQDAVSTTFNFGSHSLLSSSLNIGLLTPRDVVQAILKKFKKQGQPKTLMPSVEGFIRQIIGWRSYVRMLYEFHGDAMLKMNYLNHTNQLPKSWYTGATGIAPIDFMIKKAHDYAYLHHIERLMYMGNFALLCQIDPKRVYDWFMICFIDSYEWVMVANVMGMSQFALRDIKMMTRPYFSSSNYVLKMSNFRRDEWCETWDTLYYAFIDKHKTLLSKIYATASHVKRWQKKSENDRKELLKKARKLLKN